MRSERGCIQKLGENHWRIRVSAGVDPETGKRIRLTRTVRGSRKDALNAQTQLFIEAGDVVRVSGSLTFGQFIEDVFLARKAEQVERGDLRKTSYERIESTLIPAAQAAWNTPLTKITPFHMELCISKFSTPASRFNAYVDLRAAWNKAMKWGFVPKTNDVFESVEKPKKPIPEITTASPELLLKIFEMVRDKPVEPIVLLMAGCGLRCSEACGVDWEFFDWDEGIVPVTRGYHKIRGGTVFQPPKTVASGSLVTMPPGIKNRLYELCHDEKGQLIRHGALVHMGPKGNYERAHPHWVGDTYRNLYRKVLPDEPYVTIKNLRHSHATILLESGEDIALVSKRLRHSNLATTYLRYTKPGLEADRHSSSLFEQALNASQAVPTTTPPSVTTQPKAD